MKCQHENRDVKLTYLGMRENGGKLASKWVYCADCKEFLYKTTTGFAFHAGSNFYGYWERHKAQSIDAAMEADNVPE